MADTMVGDTMFRGKKHARLTKRVGKLSEKAEKMRTGEKARHGFKAAARQGAKTQHRIERVEKKIEKTTAKAGSAATKYAAKTERKHKTEVV